MSYVNVASESDAPARPHHADLGVQCCMSLNFLLRMAGQELPYCTVEPVEVRSIEVLNEAQLIVARLPERGVPPTGDFAVVESITQLGYDVIKRMVKML